MGHLPVVAIRLAEQVTGVLLAVLRRTLVGDPDQLRKYWGPNGIEVLREEDSKKAANTDSYMLLFPSKRAGAAPLAAAKWYTISGDAPFKIDEAPGIDKFYLIVSPTALDVGKYFDPNTGKIRAEGDLLNQLNKELSSWEANAEVTIVSRHGSTGRPDSYGITIDSKKPSMTEVDLLHYPK